MHTISMHHSGCVRAGQMPIAVVETSGCRHRRYCILRPLSCTGAPSSSPPSLTSASLLTLARTAQGMRLVRRQRRRRQRRRRQRRWRSLSMAIAPYMRAPHPRTHSHCLRRLRAHLLTPELSSARLEREHAPRGPARRGLIYKCHAPPPLPSAARSPLPCPASGACTVRVRTVRMTSARNHQARRVDKQEAERAAMYARWRAQSARPLRTSYQHAELLAALKRELPHEIDLPPEAVCWTEEQLRAMIKNTPTSARETAEAKRVPQPQAMAKGKTLGLLAQLDAAEEYDMVTPPPPPPRRAPPQPHPTPPRLQPHLRP